MVEVYLHYYLRYNYMFQVFTIAIFRLDMNPWKVVIQELIGAVYSRDLGGGVRLARDLVLVMEAEPP
jgi:hypothetical protein